MACLHAAHTHSKCLSHAIQSFTKYSFIFLFPCVRTNHSTCFRLMSILKFTCGVICLLLVIFHETLCVFMTKHKLETSRLFDQVVCDPLTSTCLVLTENDCKTPHQKTASHVLWTLFKMNGGQFDHRLCRNNVVKFPDGQITWQILLLLAWLAI